MPPSSQDKPNHVANSSIGSSRKEMRRNLAAPPSGDEDFRAWQLAPDKASFFAELSAGSDSMANVAKRSQSQSQSRRPGQPPARRKGLRLAGLILVLGLAALAAFAAWFKRPNASLASPGPMPSAAGTGASPAPLRDAKAPTPTPTPPLASATPAPSTAELPGIPV